MRIIYDNIIYTLQRYGGISVVWSNLLQRMLKREDCKITALEYEGAENNNISRRTIHIPNDVLHLVKSKFLKITRYFDPSASVIDLCGRESPFIFHSSYYRICKHKNAINVTTVHDFTYEYFERNPLARFIHCSQKHRAIRRSDHVVCISENTRNDLLKLMPDVNPAKVSVIYNGVDRRFHRQDNGQYDYFALFVGNRKSYKNFIAILKPLSKCDICLKIVGKSLTKEEKKALTNSGIKYDYCGMVSGEELNNLYNRAFCLIYPSLYEGFGLPVIEAQMAGCPVIAYNASSIPEIIGDKRLLINQIDAETLKEKFSMLSNPTIREDIIVSGIRNAQRFTWKKMEDEYYHLYKHLLQQKQFSTKL